MFTPSECEEGLALGESHRTIVLLRELLESERAEKEYYRDLLLAKVGLINQVQVEVDLNDYEPIRRRTTLSSLRKEAQEASRTKIADPEELTEAEKLFEEEIAKV